MNKLKTIIICALFGALLIPSVVNGWGVVGISGGVAAESEYEISDDFSSDTSADYTQTSEGNQTPTLTVSDGSAHSTSGYSAKYYHKTALSSVNHYAQATCSAADADYSAIMVRATDDTHYLVYASGTYIKLARVVDGSLTWLANGSGSISDTSTHTYKLSVSGTGDTVTIKFYYDGSEWIDYDDTDASRITTGTHVGPTFRRETCTTEPTMDNFIGDTL